MSEDKKSFLVYNDIKPILDKLPDEQVGALFRAMVNYSTDRIEPKFDDLALDLTFIPIKQQMDRNIVKWDGIKEKRSEAGRKGGLRSAELRREANEANATFASSASEANEANQAVKVKATGTVTGTGKVKEKGEGKVSADRADGLLSLSEKIISYLNEKTGAKYPTDSRTASSKIYALADEGYTEADMRMVIDKKCADWLYDDKMREQLRPSTLFGVKFEEYLNAPVSLKMEKEQKRADAQSDLKRQLREKNDALAAIRDSIESMKDEDGRIRENIQEYRLLKEQAAILEDTITQIEKRLHIN